MNIGTRSQVSGFSKFNPGEIRHPASSFEFPVSHEKGIPVHRRERVVQEMIVVYNVE